MGHKSSRRDAPGRQTWKHNMKSVDYKVYKAKQAGISEKQALAESNTWSVVNEKSVSQKPVESADDTFFFTIPIDYIDEHQPQPPTNTGNDMEGCRAFAFWTGAAIALLIILFLALKYH